MSHLENKFSFLTTYDKDTKEYKLKTSEQFGEFVNHFQKLLRTTKLAFEVSLYPRQRSANTRTLDKHPHEPE